MGWQQIETIGLSEIEIYIAVFKTKECYILEFNFWVKNALKFLCLESYLQKFILSLFFSNIYILSFLIVYKMYNRWG